MEEKPEPSPITNEQPNLCEECKSNPSKYKCPGCSLRTCSLPCINSHKKRTACTGKRCLSDVVPISQFNDNLLLSDYNMLEEVKRMADSARRVRAKLCGYHFNFRLPYPLKSLQSAAASRRIKLLFFPNGMSRREANRTYYDNRKKLISWSIEWRFRSTDVVLVDHGIDEDKTLSSVIENHLKPGPWNHPLRQFCNQTSDSLKFFIRKDPKGVKSPYCQLNIKEPIHEQLKNKIILEYPIIHVFLPSHSYDFQVINYNISRKIDIKEPAHDDYIDNKNVPFREEEIKDEGSSDLLVSDLMNHENPNRGTVEKRKESLQSLSATPGGKPSFYTDTCTMSPEYNDIASDLCMKQLSDIPDIDFDFDPVLMDMYEDLIGENNSDEFLNFDGLLAEDRVPGGFLQKDEELEEGEIA